MIWLSYLATLMPRCIPQHDGSLGLLSGARTAHDLRLGQTTAATGEGEVAELSLTAESPAELQQLG